MQRGVVHNSCAELFNVYIFAKQFGWTPEQVGELDVKLAREMLILMDEIGREEERQMKQIGKKR